MNDTYARTVARILYIYIYIYIFFIENKKIKSQEHITLSKKAVKILHKCSMSIVEGRFS